LHTIVLKILKEYAPRQKKIEVAAEFPLPLADFLREKGFALEIKNPFRPERAVKTPDEINKIREAIEKTCLAYKKMENILHESRIKNNLLYYRGEPLTSELLKTEAERVFFEEGMTSSEGIIIASGKQSAIPHHTGHGTIRTNESIVCDLFPVSRENGYFADMTRTYVKGKPSARLQKMYEAVIAAQEAAIAIIKPGVPMKDLHNAAAKVLRAHGFDVGERGFTHSLGHGIGLEIHEHPRVGPNSNGVLEPGNVITIEPGLYYPTLGGIRIEDVVVVTQTSYTNLTNYPKKFIIP
jgi:Xaa-Pro aminopeptidase